MDTPAPVPTLLPRPTPSGSSITKETLTFDTLPLPPWYLVKSISGTSPMSVSGGILTANSPNAGDYYWMPIDGQEPYKEHPNDTWSRYVSNTRGWLVEARMRVDPLTPTACTSITDQGGVGIRAGDFDRVVYLKFGSNAMCLFTFSYPDTQIVAVPMDTTGAFHVYRLQVQRSAVRVYVDGALTIDYVIPDKFHGGDPGISFGNFSIVPPVRSYWDYFTFDVSGLP